MAAEKKIKAFLDSIGQTQHNFAFCPRCGVKVDDEYEHKLQAISRAAHIRICNRCGTEEAMEDTIGERKPLANWAIVKEEQNK